MAEATVESLFGTKAGIIWKALHKNGPSNLATLVKTTSLSREDVFGALGWLGREDKIIVEQKGRVMIFSLREEEARISIHQETAAADCAPGTRSKHRRSKSPKNTKKAGNIKSSVKMVESSIKQTDRMEDFLLH